MPDGFPGTAELSEKNSCDIAISETVRFLRDPSNYPGHENRIEVEETHFSWVFLTASHAYKLKKPACGDGFDFRSVEARKSNALTEVRLNRRLARDIYLGIVALTREPGGALKLGGVGTPIDWLVKMVRLEADRMLDRRLARGDWSYAELEALAQRLAQFFAGARPVPMAPRKHIALIRHELDRAANSLLLIGEPRLRNIATSVVRSLDAFVSRRASLFRRRIEERHLVDGHGDLRPEHIYLAGTPQIIDCLEFRADLRRVDPVSEIAFLALESDRLGRSPIAHRLMRRYGKRTGDKPPAAFGIFYTALNAVIRAQLAIDHIAEPGKRTRAEWTDRAASYLAIAAAQCQQLSRWSQSTRAATRMPMRNSRWTARSASGSDP